MSFMGKSRNLSMQGLEIRNVLKNTGYHNTMRASFLCLLIEEIYSSKTPLLSLLRSSPHEYETLRWIRAYQIVINYLKQNKMEKTITVIDKELSQIYRKQKTRDDILFIKEDPKYTISYYTTKLSLQQFKLKNSPESFIQRIKTSSNSDSDLDNFLRPGSSEDPDEVNMKNPDYFIYLYEKKEKHQSDLSEDTFSSDADSY